MRNARVAFASALFAACVVGACDDDEIEADRLTVGWECGETSPCPDADSRAGGVQELECLGAFAGGYCSVAGCTTSAECPVGSICVHHTDDQTYCFRACNDTPECNRHRTTDDAAECVEGFVWQDPAEADGRMACIPPPSGARSDGRIVSKRRTRLP